MSIRYSVASALIVTLLASGSALATPFDFIRIGDQDGFGFTGVGSLVAANGGPADTNSNGLLQQTEFLPDLNTDGRSNTQDNFDTRSAAEVGDTGGLAGSGYTDQGSAGFKWTDIGLSTAYSGSDFPDPGGPGTPNNPVFEFRFHVADGDIVEGSTIFFNLIFGDFDVSPANVDLTFASAADRTIGLSVQGGGLDGLIQAATSTLLFNEVFTAAGGGGWDGLVVATFDAPGDPYTAFDFAELALDEIPFTAVPEPGTLAILGLGLIGLGYARRKRSA